MKHVYLLLCVVCLALACPSAQAAAADELYVKVFNTVLQGDSLQDAGQGKPALEKYLSAQEELKKLQAAYKTWEPKLVAFRLVYLDDQIKKLNVQFPGTVRSTFCEKNAIEKLLPLPCVCQKTPSRPWFS